MARLQRAWEGGKVNLYRSFVGPGNRNLLDVGCGDGRFLSLLRDKGDALWHPVGLEFDAQAVAACKAKGFEAHCERIEDFAEREDQQGRLRTFETRRSLHHRDTEFRRPRLPNFFWALVGALSFSSALEPVLLGFPQPSTR